MKQNRAEKYLDNPSLIRRINSLTDGWSVCALASFKEGIFFEFVLVLEREV